MAEMIPVSSSNIAAIGYDEEANELLVLFASGKTYAYSGVGKVTYEDMLRAGSVGQYFARNIRNTYPGRQV